MSSKILLVAAFLAACGGVSLPKERVLVHPRVHLIFWGSAWNAADYGARWETLLNASPCLDRLAEYGNSGAAFVPPTYQPASSPIPETSGNVAPDGDIVLALNAAFRSGALPIPVPSQEDVYIVFLPTDTTTQLMAVDGAIGYHLANEFEGAWFTYALIRDVGDRSGIVASHELYEAITDPYGLGWRDAKGNEVGDLCEGQTETFGDTTVQQVWSAAQGKCI